MAIEIEPEKKESHLVENLILVFSIIIFLISLSFYFYFNNTVNQKLAELNNLRSTYAALSSPDIKAKEDSLALAGKYIGDFKILFENNPNLIGFFISFQKWTHPKVVYSGFTFDASSRKATMVGSTNGFQNIMQQMAILKIEPSFESYEISNINLGEGGEITFNLDLITRPEIIK